MEKEDNCKIINSAFVPQKRETGTMLGVPTHQPFCLSKFHIEKNLVIGEINTLIHEKFKELNIKVEPFTIITGFSIDIGQKNIPENARDFLNKIRREAELQIKEKYKNDNEVYISIKKITEKL